VLRCFYGESLRTGEDLKAELRRLREKRAHMIAVVAVVLGAALVGMTAEAKAATPGNAGGTVRAGRLSVWDLAGPTPTVSPPELDRVIRQTIQKREYAWRFPRRIV